MTRLRALIAPLASLRLTVALLALAMVLTFAGTLAQTRLGVWQVVDGYFRSAVAWVDLGLFLPLAGPQASFAIPFPGGGTLAVLMLANLLAAHAMRFQLTAKRAGILLLHAGLIVLIVGELITGAFAREGLMRIAEGQQSSVIEDIREVELAVIDPSDPAFDRVVIIPGSQLAAAAADGQPIADPRLPVDVRVLQWLPNAELARRTGAALATAGDGLDWAPRPLPAARGVDGAATDAPAAYVALARDGRPLGTWLVSTALDHNQAVTDGPATFGLALRYRRTYRPYSVHLLDFTHETYTGTSIPRHFASHVRVTDSASGDAREAVISMNQPLRYAGETFYQASYAPDGKGTVLQVVRNPGWLLPYVACVMVGVGLCYHFMLGLVGFLRRPRAGAADAAPPAASLRWPVRLGIVVLGLAIGLHALLRPPPANAADLATFGTLPVLSNGRVKPMDTAARNVLMVAGGRQTAASQPAALGATQYLLELVARPERIADLPVVRVDHPEVQALLQRTSGQGKWVSLAAIEPHWSAVAAQAARAEQAPQQQRDPYQRAVLELHHRVTTLLAHMQLFEPYVVLPDDRHPQWRSFRQGLEQSMGRQPPPAVAYVAAMMEAYAAGDTDGFNRAVRGYDELLRRDQPALMTRMDIEVLFNRAGLFTGTALVYGLAVLLLAGAALAAVRSSPWAERLRAATVVLLWTALLLHTVGLALRIYLQGRPPVTNLYSSALFVGWAAVLVALVVEWRRPFGVAALGAAVLGLLTLLVGASLGTDGDTLQAMQAVLDSNFWLATHVVTITLGYSATFLAGTLGMFYLVARVVRGQPDRTRTTQLENMIHGVVCLALLLSFVGTVLGGIWADQSWGRFWGWDPKENGAALVVLMNAIILHARWAGLIRGPSLAALAVGGNIVTAWSWFGTNMLGVGLHAYGFMASAAFWLVAFVLSQLAVMALALLPARSRPVAA